MPYFAQFAEAVLKFVTVKQSVTYNDLQHLLTESLTELERQGLLVKHRGVYMPTSGGAQ